MEYPLANIKNLDKFVLDASIYSYGDNCDMKFEFIASNSSLLKMKQLLLTRSCFTEMRNVFLGIKLTLE